MILEIGVFIRRDRGGVTRYSDAAFGRRPDSFLQGAARFSTLADMINSFGYTHHWKLALALGLLTSGAAVPAFAQQSPLPVPGLEEQMTAQQPAPAAPEPSQAQLGIQTESQTALPADTTGTATAGSQQPVATGTNAALDEMRARAQGRAPGAPGDALPAVNNIRVQTQGMDYTATDTVNMEMRDIPLDTSSDEYKQGIREEAFGSVANGMFPLTTDEIREILRRYDETRRAVETPHYDLPKPEIKVETISLDPGVTPPTINTAVGHVTTLTVLDVTGAPWPIQDVTWAGDFEVVEPEEGGHIVRITPMANFAYGNVSMRLLTLKTPITFTLRTGRDSVQYRFDARIPEYGPMAEAQIIEGGGKGTVAGDKVLTQILDGIVPEGAERLAVGGVDGRTTALLVSGTTYLRTPLTLLSPAWDSSVKSADGMNVYAMEETPVVLLSDAGSFRRATLRPREGLFDE